MTYRVSAGLPAALKAPNLHQLLKMSDVQTQRTLQDARNAFKCSKNPHSYDQWADTYITDHTMMGYKGPYVTAEVLMKHFTLSPEKVRVLDLACGTGWVAQQLFSLGFRDFVGVDGSQPMLDKACLTGLYQDLHLTLLGTEPLPVDSGMEALNHMSLLRG